MTKKRFCETNPIGQKPMLTPGRKGLTSTVRARRRSIPPQPTGRRLDPAPPVVWRRMPPKTCGRNLVDGRWGQAPRSASLRSEPVPILAGG